MKVTIMDWDCYGKQDAIDTFLALNWNVMKYSITPRIARRNTEYENLFAEFLKKEVPDIVFSFNYFPIVSTVCQTIGIKYVSWVYDAPHASLYSYTITNSCNQIFVFDKALSYEFSASGFKNIHYLPLAVNTDRIENILATNNNNHRKYCHDISFVGSLYIEPKHNLFARLSNLSEETKGYLDGLIISQLKMWGCNFVEECLTSEIIDEMHSLFPLDPHPDGVETQKYLYAQYVINRKITSLDRIMALENLRNVSNVHLYTNYSEYQIPGITNHGPVDYETEMPFIFHNTKINLNSTLRSIKSGIPLRALDIMGCGGFLLSNFQADMMDYFTLGKDFVIFEDMDDLITKTKFYLDHEDARLRIAENGKQKIEQYFTYKERIEDILRICL